VGDKVEEIILYKYPVNGVPPPAAIETPAILSIASNKEDRKNN
jgi:hypothetical protein